MLHAKSLGTFCLLLIATAFALPTYADDKIAAADSAFQVIGRVQVTALTGPGAGTAFTLGYLAAISGIPDPLFGNSGAASEANAFFTLRSDSYGFSTIVNGDTKVRFRTPGVLVHVYFNPTPNGDFTLPDTFSSGTEIATFRVTNSMATNVSNVASDVTSSELIASRKFTFSGHHYDFKHIVKNGVTQISAASALPVGATGILATQTAFSGTAIAIGD